MRFFDLFVGFELSAGSGPNTSSAETIVLKFAHPYPPMHPQYKGVLVPWAQKIEEASGGTVKIKFIPGGALGKPGQAYAMVEKISPISVGISPTTAPDDFP